MVLLKNKKKAFLMESSEREEIKMKVRSLQWMTVLLTNFSEHKEKGILFFHSPCSMYCSIRSYYYFSHYSLYYWLFWTISLIRKFQVAIPFSLKTSPSITLSYLLIFCHHCQTHFSKPVQFTLFNLSYQNEMK